MKKTITFGRIIIDRLHMFFGKHDPIAFVVADTWGSEKDDGKDHEVWCDHYRGHIKFSYKQLRDKKRFTITDKFVDPNKNIQDQLKQIV